MNYQRVLYNTIQRKKQTDAKSVKQCIKRNRSFVYDMNQKIRLDNIFL